MARAAGNPKTEIHAALLKPERTWALAKAVAVAVATAWLRACASAMAVPPPQTLATAAATADALLVAAALMASALAVATDVTVPARYQQHQQHIISSSAASMPLRCIEACEAGKEVGDEDTNKIKNFEYLTSKGLGHCVCDCGRVALAGSVSDGTCRGALVVLGSLLHTFQ